MEKEEKREKIGERERERERKKNRLTSLFNGISTLVCYLKSRQQ